MAEELVTLAEAGELLEARLGRKLSRQEVRWLITRKGAGVDILPKAVVIEVTRQTRADGIRVADLDKLEEAARAASAG